MKRISISDLSLARSVYASGNTIKAIKMIRDITGCTLREAKSMASGIEEVNEKETEVLDPLTAAQARIVTLETALQALVNFDDKNYYQKVHITQEPEVMKQARKALEVKP